MKIILLFSGLLMLAYPSWSDNIPVDFWEVITQLFTKQDKHIYLRVVPAQENKNLITDSMVFIFGIALIIYSLFYYKPKQ